MYIDFKMPMFFATVCQLMCVCLCVAAGNITQEDQPRAESAMKRLIDAFGLTQQSCMTAYMALLKCVAFNVQEAYNKMLEGEPLSLSLHTLKSVSDVLLGCIASKKFQRFDSKQNLFWCI